MLQQQMARERDTFEVVAFLRAENDTLQERLKHFEGKHVTALASSGRTFIPSLKRSYMSCRCDAVVRNDLRSHSVQARLCAPSATRRMRNSGWVKYHPTPPAPEKMPVITIPQVNAARDERIKEIETKTQLEMEAKEAEVAGLQARLKKVTLFEEQQRKLEEERWGRILLQSIFCFQCVQGEAKAGGV